MEVPNVPSKVRQSRSKAIVSKVSTSSSTPAVSSDVAELKDMVRALILDKKNQTPAPAPVKAIEQSCVTCGGGHSYQNCPATDGNIYRDNIQEYVSQAAHLPTPDLSNTRLSSSTPYQAPASAPPHPAQNLQPMFRKLLIDKDRWIELTKYTGKRELLGGYLQRFPEKLGRPRYLKVLKVASHSTSDLTIGSRSPSFTPFGGSDFLMEEIDAFLEHDDSIPPGVDGIYDSEGDIVYLEELLSVINSDPNLPPSPVCEINVPEKVKSSCEDPLDLELKDLPSHLEYAFLEGDDKLPVIIAKNLKDEDKTALIKMLERLAGNEYYCFLDGFSGYFQIPIDPLDQEKTTFTCPYGTFAYRHMPFGLCNAPGTCQRCMVAIVHDMIETIHGKSSWG
ncbi:reverse transcriptase domain-containing protein [Tanacetum coccineum]